MKVKKISVANVEVSSLPKLLDEEKIGFQPVSKVNWNEYPYCPESRIPGCSYGGCHFTAFQGNGSQCACPLWRR